MKKIRIVEVRGGKRTIFRNARLIAEENGSSGDKSPGDRSGHKAGQSCGQKCAKTKAAEIFQPVWSDSTDASNKDGEGSDVGETAEGV